MVLRTMRNVKISLKCLTKISTAANTTAIFFCFQICIMDKKNYDKTFFKKKVDKAFLIKAFIKDKEKIKLDDFIEHLKKLKFNEMLTEQKSNKRVYFDGEIQIGVYFYKEFLLKLSFGFYDKYWVATIPSRLQGVSNEVLECYFY